MICTEDKLLDLCACFQVLKQLGEPNFTDIILADI